MSLAEAKDAALRLDADDALARFRHEFALPVNADGEPLVYFCGNSLGLQPKGAAEVVEREMRAWRELGVEGHFRSDPPWVEYEKHLIGNLSNLVGAAPHETLVMNALTVNLHLMMASFYRPSGRRRKVLLESHAFPSDRYAVVSQALWHDLDPDDVLLELPTETDGLTSPDALAETLARHGEDIALVLLPGIQYATGERFDEREACRLAHDAGCTVGFDLAHAIGNVPVGLHDSGCDFAVWCTYKYLNAGPGSTGGAFVHERHHASDRVRLSGWFGNAMGTRFEMRQRIDPAAGANAWVVSNPAVLSTAPLGASLELFASATLRALREKSIRLTGFLETLILKHLGDHISILTPSDPERRGAQLSLQVRAGRAAGRRLFENMSAAGVVGDWREPDVIRLAPAPLYNTFSECVRCVEILRRAV